MLHLLGLQLMLPLQIGGASLLRLLSGGLLTGEFLLLRALSRLFLLRMLLLLLCLNLALALHLLAFRLVSLLPGSLLMLQFLLLLNAQALLVLLNMQLLLLLQLLALQCRIRVGG